MDILEYEYHGYSCSAGNLRIFYVKSILSYYCFNPPFQITIVRLYQAAMFVLLVDIFKSFFYMYQSRSCTIKNPYGASLSNTLTFFIAQKMFYQALLGQSMEEKEIQWREVFELCRKCFIKHYQEKVCKRSKFNGKKFANCVENVLPSIFRTKYTR